DYATESLGVGAHRETVERTRERYGLNKSVADQYRDWLSRATRFDFGRSLLYDRPVGDLIPERATNTAILAFSALVGATFIGVPLGIITGSRHGGFLAGTIRATSLILLSMPPLLTSLFLVFVAGRTGWVPMAGMRSADAASSGLTVDLLRHLVMPA